MKAPLFTAVLLCCAALEASGAATRPLPGDHAAPTRVTTFDLARRIDLNQINLGVTNVGIYGFDGVHGTSDLIYPKGSGKTALFAAGLWLTGKVDGELRGAVSGYDSEYGPGSIASGNLDPGRPEYRTYKVSRFRGDVRDTMRITRTAAELAADSTLDPLLHDSWSDYLTGAAPYGAPVRTLRLPRIETPDPTDSVDVLGPAVLGDEMLWSVYNDANVALHQSTGGKTLPLGVEVQQSFFAVDAPGPLGSTVFLRYKLVNRGASTIDSLMVGLWSDPDVGGFSDDRTGSDSSLALSYAYSSYQDLVYGLSSPAIGYVLLRAAGSGSGPLALTGPFKGPEEPQNITMTRNTLLGLHGDGSAMLDPDGRPTPYWFSGDAEIGKGWIDPFERDRRLMLSTGPVTLVPGDSAVVDAAIVIGQGVDNLASVANLKCAAQAVKQFYDAGFPTNATPGLACPTAVVESCPRSLSFWQQQCAQLSQADLTRLAKCADDHAVLFGFTPGSEASEYCAILNRAPADIREQAQTEQLALVSNVCAAELGLAFAGADSAFLGQGIELWAGSVGARFVGQLAAPATSTPCFCADSLQVALVGQSVSDPYIAAQYERLLADLGAVNYGIGVGPTCPSIANLHPSFVSSFAAPGQLDLFWQARAAAGLPVAIYRLEASGWVRVGSSLASTNDIVAFYDRDVVPEHSYTYRIGVNPDGRESFYGEVTLTTPPAPPLALIGATPNPAIDALRVALTLPSRSPLKIDVFDLSGRKVASYRDEQPVLGYSVVNLGSNLKAGIYVVKIHQAGLDASAKAVVIR